MSEFNKEETDYEDQLRQSERERKDLKNIIYELPVGLITVKGGKNEHGAVDPYGRLYDV